MKLGILTQPLHCNYGGLLQAWALQQMLTRMGHEAWIIRREHVRKEDFGILHQLASTVLHGIRRIIGGENQKLKIESSQEKIICKNTNRFIESRYTFLSPMLYTDSALSRYIGSNSFEGFIVGSDQVWRPLYSPAIGNYFLDFAKHENNIKRIAYAASFGVDNWEFSRKDTQMARELVSMFDLITVREDSGVKLLKEYLNVNAYHVLDPTMLMNKSDYELLVKNPTSALNDSKGELFCYVLDPANHIKDAIDSCVSKTHYETFFCYASRRVKSEDDLRHINECIMPPVEQWLKSFMDAKMVITDSFHGTVFSIIFNKPFWVIANENRGTARFTSLLTQFDLENRIIDTHNSPDWSAPIEWTAVNNRRNELQKKSALLLSNSLTRYNI